MGIIFGFFGFLDTLGTAIGAFLGVYKNVKLFNSKKQNWSENFRAMRKRFFYDEALVRKMLFSYDGSKIKNTDFIHYRKVLNGVFYHNAGIEIKIKTDNVPEKTLKFPYEECVNFIKTPNAKIIVAPESMERISMIKPEGEYFDFTHGNLNAFREANPETYDSPKLCMKGFKKNEDEDFECLLASAGYFDIIRTNHTLDYILENRYGEDTIRKREIALGGSFLPTLDKSLLMNSIGVSAIWCMDKGKGSGKDRYHYFLKCRQDYLGIYSGMLGTVSGSVNTPDSFRLDSNNLMDYMKSEMLREFGEETKYYHYAESKGLNINDSRNVEVIPLAFTREFIRGGLPQFFFMIITPYLSDAEFVEYFKSSKDGLFEFKDGTISNLKTHQLSPETALNLCYCKQYVQNILGNDYIYLE